MGRSWEMDIIMETKEKLRHLRRRSGLSVRAVTEKLGYKSPASYNLYETRYEKAYLPLEFVKKLIPCFVGLGHPVIEACEIWELVEPSLRGGSDMGFLDRGEQQGEYAPLEERDLDPRLSQNRSQTSLSPLMENREESFPQPIFPSVPAEQERIRDVSPNLLKNMLKIEEIFFVSEGEVILSLPQNLSSESAEDIVSWLALLQRKIQRRIRR